jgi:methionyl-tRNA formyltransferase
MLPESVWSLSPLGTFNLHASLLPQYRGAAPINWALINGEKETGVTTFFLEKSIDTGNILLAERTEIGRDETAGELHDRLMEIGADLVCRTADTIINGRVRALSQESLADPGIVLKPAPKLTKEDGLIRWDTDVLSIYNRIRGLSPFPGAFTKLTLADASSFELKIYKARPEQVENVETPGTPVTDGRNCLKISAMNGYIQLLNVQPSGRKAMETGEFLRGYGRIFL